jgi:predicted RNase H-like HicB family nuclease
VSFPARTAIAALGSVTSLTLKPMKTARQLTAIIEREDDSYVALCPELDIASQGDTVESARQNLVEALELFFESADPTEVARRLHSEVFVTRVEVMVG